MDLNTVLENIENFKNSELEQSKRRVNTLDTSDTPAPVDLYQQNYNKRFEQGKKSYPHGSSVIVGTAVANVVDEQLARAHKRAKDDSDLLKNKGEGSRAEMVRQQYMEEYFLPAVEIVVNSTSPDEVLNSKKALDELDRYVLLEGSGRGYTASYIRQAYGNQLGQLEGHSDAYIASQVRKLNALLDEGQIRSAVGLARNLKNQIDNGEHVAGEEDFELLGRIVAYYG